MAPDSPPETVEQPAAGAPTTPLGPAQEPPAADWASEAVGKVEDLVSVVRDKAVTPVTSAARYVALAFVALAVGGLATALFAIFALRVLDTEVPAFHGRVWASYLVLGGIFAGLAVLFTRMRRPRK